MRSITFFLLATLAGSVFGAQVPRKSPEFVIQPPGEKPVLLSSYRGKVVCLMFILTT